MRSFVWIFLIIFSIHEASAQKENNIWYFGDGAGLDFNSGSPVVLTDGAINTYEGCSSIANENGSLLFYTDGVTVYNKNHQPMPNGFALDGSNSSFQSALIIKKPQSSSLYYIFTVDCVENLLVKGLRYSIVDISLDGGKGDVTVKNSQLIAPTPEKVCAAYHYNGEDIWVISHEYDSDAFYAYPVTNAGVGSPVISHVGLTNTGGNADFPKANGWGVMKISPDGKKVVNTMPIANQLFDFNNETGVVSNPLNLDGENGATAEFSPDSKKLYLGTYQYDLYAGSSTDIINSRVEVITNVNGFISEMQIGPDGEIYIARGFWYTPNPYLSVIVDPNNSGTACHFVDQGIYLNGKNSFIGLPNQIYRSSKDFISGDFTHLEECLLNPVIFTSTTNRVADSIQWDFDDPASGENNYSKDPDPSHAFSTPGVYEVKFKFYFKSITDSVIHEVIIPELLTVDLGPDVSECKEPSLTLQVKQGFNEYQWSTGSNQNFILANASGKYWVKVGDGCSYASDTIEIIDKKIFIPNLISPNSDQHNDYLLIDGQGMLEIYDRWGEKIFSEEKYSNKWGQDIDPGIYYYFYKDEQCGELKGWIQLIK